MNFLGKSGVSRVWSLMKTYVASVKTSLEESINAVAGDKQDMLVSGTNIKTLNGNSLLGSGDITIDLTLYKLVDELPTENIDTNKIYLVQSETEGESNVYTEYIYANSAWEKMGEYKSDVDLSPYAKTADVETSLALKADKSDTYTKTEVDTKITASGTFVKDDYYTKTDIDTALGGKVDTVEGKGLSTNDYDDTEKAAVAANTAARHTHGNKTVLDATTASYTTEEQTKLTGIAANATADGELSESDIDEVCV